MPTRVTPGSGAILQPIIETDFYSVVSIDVLNGGSGYASTDPPKITITNTQIPEREGVFYPIISGGSIQHIKVIDGGSGYFSTGEEASAGTPIGIATTSVVESSQIIQIVSGNTAYLSVASRASSIIMEVGGGSIGSAIYEDGYNVAISTSITGISSIDVTHASKNVFYGYGNPFPQKSTSGIGTDAKFSVFIVYNNTGTPISTSIILNDGGRGYVVGNTVSISGTYIGGATPTNDLSFNVSKIANSRLLGQANQIYTDVPSTTAVGYGTGAIFTVSRDGVGSVNSIEVANGGVGYALTDQIVISGSNVGGSSPLDNIYLSPTVLGTNVLPKNLYIHKSNDNKFTVSGLSTTVDYALDLTNLGIGTQSFSLANPNESSFIAIDNVIQSPPYNRGLYPELAVPVGTADTTIYLKSGISSISGFDFIKIEDEFMKINSVGIGSTNAINVERSFMGTRNRYHNLSKQVSIMRGDYNISNGVLYLSTPPYGKIPYQEKSSSGVTSTLYAKSSFQGRVFSREFDDVQAPNDKNIILDDISLKFSGIDNIIGIYTGTLNPNYPSKISGISTSNLLIGDVLNLQYTNNLLIDSNTIISKIETNSINIQPNHNVIVGTSVTTFIISRNNFPLTSNQNTVVGLYTDTNSTFNSNNNPLIMINNIIQVSGKDFIIDTEGNNTIKFISGTPNSGRISKVAITTGYGYQPLVGASATVSVSVAGTVSNVYLTGYGSGYRENPQISIASSIGSGAVITGTIGAGGTVTSLTIVNPGSGYTPTSIPKIVVGLPSAYSNLSLYNKDPLGVGTAAKISVSVGNGSSITQFNIDEPGRGYKVGQVLGVIGITTNPNVGIGFSEFTLTITEVLSDKFFGYYPGQFVQFDDLSPYFNGAKKRFSLTVTEDNKTRIISLKTDPGSDLDINNNIFVFINNILQEPGKAYTYKNSKLIFTEAPKEKSTCNVLFYRGSSRDVEQIVPPETIKEGDTVKINKDLSQPLIREQFERIVKRVVSVDEIDTFTYDSLGIDTSTYRSLEWTKQTEDKIINGVLYTKSRTGLKSKVTPTAQIIKKVSPSDTNIYVDNAFPIFSNVDNLSSGNRNITIVENRSISAAYGIASVSSASTITSVNISYSGFGYQNNLSPVVNISNSKLYKKDLVYDWNPTNGITTSNNFKSIISGNVLVSVGQSQIISNSFDGLNWNYTNSGISTLNNVSAYGPIGIAKSFTYVSVGNNATILRSVGIGSVLSAWESCLLFDPQATLNQTNYIPSIYTGNLNSIFYSQTRNNWVCVGNVGAIFCGVGIQTNRFINSTKIDIISNLNDITANDNIFVVVGDSGTILYSTNGTSGTWQNTLQNISSDNLYKIIWDGFKFISVGDNSTILVSSTGTDNWSKINGLNILTNFRNIKYYKTKSSDESGIYYAINDSGQSYQSNDLLYWLPINTNQLKQITDFVYNPSIGDEGRMIAVGYGGTIIYSEPKLHYPSFSAHVSNESIISIDIIDGGFGYSQNNEIPFFVESDSTKTETIYTVKVRGDYGNITNISVASSTINFTLKPEKYDNSTLGIGYSSLDSYGVNYSSLNIGDYFVITESNSICGHALTGITTSIGGMANYPASRIGTATTHLDGVYRVERVLTDITSGITTIGCNFAPGPSGYPIDVTVGINTFGFYGKYSWGLFYNYQNRQNRNPKTFDLNTNNGLTGLSTAPVIFRTRSLI